MISLSNSNIEGFVQQAIWPRLPADYFVYKKRGLARMRGPFVQLLVLSKNKSGRFLKAHPTLYVAGAEPGMATICQNVSLEVWAPRKWMFDSPALDSSFARNLVLQIERETPVSFVQPLTDTSINRAFHRFNAKSCDWHAQFFLAFLSILQNKRSAYDDLRLARKRFQKLTFSRVSKIAPWVDVLSDRFSELENRIGRSDCLSLCRVDCQHHAELLKLPLIDWPDDWPSS